MQPQGVHSSDASHLPEESNYKDYGYEGNPRCAFFQCAMSIANIALAVIGALAIAGIFPGSSTTFGWTMVGLGVGIALFQIFTVKPQKRICQIFMGLVTSIAFVGVGALGISGVLSTHQLGIAALTISLGGVGACNFGYLGSCSLFYDCAINSDDEDAAQTSSTEGQPDVPPDSSIPRRSEPTFIVPGQVSNLLMSIKNK